MPRMLSVSELDELPNSGGYLVLPDPGAILGEIHHSFFKVRKWGYRGEMNPVAGDHCFVKGKPRFGTIPANEIVDGTPIASHGGGSTKTSRLTLLDRWPNTADISFT